MQEAMNLIEGVLDTLCEVGNGVTEEHLKQAASELFAARDLLDEMKDTRSEYEEISARDAAAKIAPSSLFTAYFWYTAFVELEKMGYVICKKTM